MTWLTLGGLSKRLNLYSNFDGCTALIYNSSLPWLVKRNGQRENWTIFATGSSTKIKLMPQKMNYQENSLMVVVFHLLEFFNFALIAVIPSKKSCSNAGSCRLCQFSTETQSRGTWIYDWIGKGWWLICFIFLFCDCNCFWKYLYGKIFSFLLYFYIISI